MKKFLIILFVFLLLSASNIFAAEIFINEKNANCESIILNNRIMVPVRGVFEKLGYSITWNKDSETALLVNNENRITIRNGANVIYVNAKAINPDVPQIIINGSMYIPLRAVSEAINVSVEWDDSTKTVSITTPEKIITLNEISRVNTLENILNLYGSVTIKNSYSNLQNKSIAQNYEISFGKDEDGNYIYTYSDSNGLKRLMCHKGEFTLSPDGETSYFYFENDEQRSNSIMNCYNFVDSSMMIASSENGTIFTTNKHNNQYKATVTIVQEQSLPTYAIWSDIWGITDKKFDICYEYTLDKNTLAVLKSNVSCLLSDGRFEAGTTSQSYSMKITIPDEFKDLVNDVPKVSA